VVKAQPVHWLTNGHEDSGARRGGYGYIPADTVTEGVYLSGARPLSSLKEIDKADSRGLKAGDSLYGKR
jgi:hypothetical protein